MLKKNIISFFVFLSFTSFAIKERSQTKTLEKDVSEKVEENVLNQSKKKKSKAKKVKKRTIRTDKRPKAKKTEKRNVPSFAYLSVGFSFTESISQSSREMTLSRLVSLGIYWYYGDLQVSTTTGFYLGEVFYLPATQSTFSVDKMGKVELMALGDINLGVSYNIYKSSRTTIAPKFTTKIPTDINSGTRKSDNKIEGKWTTYLKKTKPLSVILQGSAGVNYISKTSADIKFPVGVFTGGISVRDGKLNTFGLTYYNQGSVYETISNYAALILSYTGKGTSKYYTTFYTSFGLNKHSSRISIGLSRMGLL